MPKCYQLVGVPCSGKTTWADLNVKLLNYCVHVSTDKYVEIEALWQRKTYSEIFKEYIPIASNKMFDDVKRAKALAQDIIWDQTSLTIRSRAQKFKMLPDYDHIAVVFQTPETTELQRRLNSRPGKEIPNSVMEGMISGFVIPTEDEGFSKILYVNSEG